MSIARWEQGRADIDRLITQGRLERVTPNQQHAQVLLEQARKAIQSAAVLATTDDTITAVHRRLRRRPQGPHRHPGQPRTTAGQRRRRPRCAPGGSPGPTRAAAPARRSRLRLDAADPQQVRLPEPDGATATDREVTDAIEAAHAIIQVAAKVIPVMPVYGR